MKIVIAAGGTGGHIMPALVLFHQLKAEGHEVRFMCRPVDLELTVQLQAIKEECFLLSSIGWRRRLGLDLPVVVAGTLKSVLLALGFIKKFKPDVTVTFGGYPGFAPALAAKLKGRKVAMIEQNSIPGLANKLIYPMADLVILNYEITKKWFTRGRVIGNPVNPAIGKADKSEAIRFFGLDPAEATVLIIGGSQGAKGLNEIIVASQEGLDIYNVLWSCGRKHYESLSLRPEIMENPNVKLHPFIERMDLAWAAADIIVARSGASTISEMKAAKVPGVLVPFPAAAENHQFFNAMEMHEHGVAEVIEEKDLTPESLVCEVAEVMEARTAMKDNFFKFGSKDVNREITDAIVAIPRKG